LIFRRFDTLIEALPGCPRQHLSGEVIADKRLRHDSELMFLFGLCSRSDLFLSTFSPLETRLTVRISLRAARRLHRVGFAAKLGTQHTGVLTIRTNFQFFNQLRIRL
jgi:hypothetical protein